MAPVVIIHVTLHIIAKMIWRWSFSNGADSHLMQIGVDLFIAIGTGALVQVAMEGEKSLKTKQAPSGNEKA